MSDTQTPAPRDGVRKFGAPGQKIPPFARYKGTSAWRKDRKRAKEYARYQAAVKQAALAAGTATA